MYPNFRFRQWLILVATFTFARCWSGSSDYVHDYYPLVYKGDLAFFEKNYQESYELLKKAVESKRPPNFEPYRELEKLANVCAILDRPEEAIWYIGQLVDRGYELSVFRNDKSYAPVWQLPQWKELEADFAARRANYLKGVNQEVRAAVVEMNRNDQMYRNRPDRQSFRRQQMELDAQNLAHLQEIFDKYGYPNYDLIGDPSVDEYTAADLSIEPILMRSPDSLRQHYFIPKLQAYVEQGACPPRMLGMLIDHYHLQHDGYQLYATMLGPKGLLGKLEQPKRVEERRREIGMPTVRQEISRDSAVNVYLMMQ
ncbi:MAG: hypothetical protein R2824_11015 [Saprospiraceae bacterium]|nr:hypothetical protein [Lewinella sp.]